MIRPVQADDRLLEDIRQVSSNSVDLHYWWLGQSGFFIKWRGSSLVFDPYLSDSLTEKYAHTDKPHVRMTERVIDPGRLSGIDCVSSSHNHTDHLDRETLLALRRANPRLQMVLPEANRAFAAERLGTPPDWPLGLTAGASCQVGAFTFHGIPSAHNELETDERGQHRFMGFVVEAGPWRIYHSGDTLRYPGMEDWLKPWKLDLAFLPINGDRPERRVAGNLDGLQAAQLAADAGVQRVVPCHYDMFEFNTATPELFIAACEARQQTYQILQAGEHGILKAATR